MTVAVLSLLLSASFGAASEDGIERFGGIGVIVAQLYDQDTPSHLGELVVLGGVEGSPAIRAGVRPGDVLVSIDGMETRGHAFEAIVRQAIRGPVGKAAVLVVRRPGEVIEFEVVRSALEG